LIFTRWTTLAGSSKLRCAYFFNLYIRNLYVAREVYFGKSRCGKDTWGILSKTLINKWAQSYLSKPLPGWRFLFPSPYLFFTPLKSNFTPWNSNNLNGKDRYTRTELLESSVYVILVYVVRLTRPILLSQLLVLQILVRSIIYVYVDKQNLFLWDNLIATTSNYHSLPQKNT
jgi:hypothetical protein